MLLLRTTSNHICPESGFWCGSLACSRIIDKKKYMGNIKAEMHSFELLATLWNKKPAFFSAPCCVCSSGRTVALPRFSRTGCFHLSKENICIKWRKKTPHAIMSLIGLSFLLPALSGKPPPIGLLPKFYLLPAPFYFSGYHWPHLSFLRSPSRPLLFSLAPRPT